MENGSEHVMNVAIIGGLKSTHLPFLTLPWLPFACQCCQNCSARTKIDILDQKSAAAVALKIHENPVDPVNCFLPFRFNETHSGLTKSTILGCVVLLLLLLVVAVLLAGVLVASFDLAFIQSHRRRQKCSGHMAVACTTIELQDQTRLSMIGSWPGMLGR